MNIGRTTSVLALAVLLLAGLPAASQPSGELNEEILAQDGQNINFYGHLFGFGAGSPMPMNTQYPFGEADYSIGTSGDCNYPPDSPAATSGDECVRDDNKAFLYTTAGFVQIKERNQFAYSKLHNERGQTKDIYLDTDQSIRSTFWQSADLHGWYLIFCDVGGPCWNWDPGYLPDWTVETRVWHANLGPWSTDPDAKPDMSVITSGEGTLIANGQTEPRDVWSFDATLPSPTCDGPCQTVHPFTAELAWDPDFVAAGGVVPYLNDLIVEFRWYSQHENGNKYLTPEHTWNTNAGEDYPPTIVFPTRNPLDVELVFPRFVHDKLVVLSVLNTPWGSYDVDLESIDVAFRNSAGQIVEPAEGTFQMFLDQSVAHSGHYDPINVTWIWDYQKQGLPAGEYDIVVSATNFQGSFSTETVATMSINKDGTGGEATAAQSGILSFTNEQFESYQGGSAAEGEQANPDAQESTEVKDTPGIGAVGVAGALGLALIRRRRD